MKTIFCATDFSKAGNNAAVYAARLAEAMNARLVVATAYSVPLAPLELPATAEADIIMARKTQESMNSLVARLSEVYSGTIIKEIGTGYPGDFIVEASRKNHADLIVLGSRQTSPLEYYLFANTVNSLLRYEFKPPVLAVPEDASYKNPALIAIAFDLEHLPRGGKATFLDMFVEKFHPELQAFYVNTVKDEKLAGKEMVTDTEAIGMDRWDSQVTFIQGMSVTEGIRDYIRHHQPDMLALVPSNHTWWEKLTLQTHTRKALQQVNIPILLL